MPTIIVKCSCNHPFQDSIYGKNKRVANKAASPNKSTSKYRCTVCATEFLFSEEEPKK